MAKHHEITDYKHGEMDITEQKKTMSGFIRLSTWVVILSIGALIFMALTNA